MALPGKQFPVFAYNKFLNVYSSLTGEQVNARRLLSTWTLHFAAKKTDYSI